MALSDAFAWSGVAFEKSEEQQAVETNNRQQPIELVSLIALAVNSAWSRHCYLPNRQGRRVD